MQSSGMERLIKREQTHHIKNSEKRVLARKALERRIRSQDFAHKLQTILIKKVREVALLRGSNDKLYLLLVGLSANGTGKTMNKKPENVEDYETENTDLCNQAGPHIMDIERESREDDDSDDDYDSILRSAFLVEGEPDLDSGPLEDGFEYLRRVRWEAAQIPKVKVAKLGRSKMNKEQSVYMPQIPEIATCLDHLLPIKKWEEMFLTDFSELRQAYVLQERGSLLELVDPALGIQYSSKEATVMLNVALLCTNASPTLRPSMSQMVSMLEGRTAFQDLLSDAGLSMVNSKFRAIRNHLWQRPSETASMSCYVPCPDYSHSNEETEVGAGLLNVCSAHSNE